MRKEWEIKKLEDVCIFQRGLTYSKNDEVELSSNIVLRSTNVHLHTSSLVFDELKYIKDEIAIPENKKVLKGSLIICTANGSKSHLGKVALIDDHYNYAFGGFMGLITPKKEIDSKFLFYIMISDSYKQFISSLSDGANINNLKFGDLGKFILSVPSLSEQKKIVFILEEVFAAIEQAKENAKRNLQNAKELFQNELNNIFINESHSWVEKTLGEVCHYEKTPNKRKDLLYVGLENIESNTGKFIGSYEAQQVKSSTFHFNNKHVLYGRLRPYLNKVLLPDFEGHCSTEIFPIMVKNEIDRGFLFYWLISSNTVEKINSTWTGARMPRANMNEVIELKFKYPLLSEQKIIVNRLDDLSAETKKLDVIYLQKLNNLEELKKSILQKAFNGELKTLQPIAI